MQSGIYSQAYHKAVKNHAPFPDKFSSFHFEKNCFSFVNLPDQQYPLLIPVFPLYFFQILSLNNLLPCKYSSINQIRKSLMVCQIFLHSLVFSPKGLHLLSLYTTYRNLLPNGIRKIQSSWNVVPEYHKTKASSMTLESFKNIYFIVCIYIISFLF